VHDEAALSQMFWEGLQKFFTLHPEYAKCPLYLCGESYAGKYVPAIALKIDEKNHENALNHVKIDLRGASVGNGWIKPDLSLQVMIDYVYATGFIGSDQRNTCMTLTPNFRKLCTQAT
jgi:carboxypeptidase C (cathepsin A)